MRGEGCRLLSEGHSNGFIPGEAAVAVLVSHPDQLDAINSPFSNPLAITGLGEGLEAAPLNSDDVCRGHGLSDAIKQACRRSQVKVMDCDYRISSVSGESYYFEEAALAQIRSMEGIRDAQPLWHPAGHVGEIGAATGPAMLLMGVYAALKQYGPGPVALCQVSNDDGQRGAFVLQQMNTQHRSHW